MKLFPIIPVWLMAIIVLALAVVIFWKNKRPNFLQLGILLLIFVINLRPMLPTGESLVMSNNLDVLLVIDNTISMVAEDYDGKKPRLEGAKQDVNLIIRELAGARFSLITFNNTARVVTPFTRDMTLTSEAVEIISPMDEFYAKGTSLNTPIETIIMSMKSSEKKTDRRRVLFFISDGEITDDSRLASFKAIAAYLSGGAVLGYGTERGGAMQVMDYDGQKTYLEDYAQYPSTRAISRIDEGNLRSIATDLGVEYINMSNKQGLEKELAKIKNMIEASQESSDRNTYSDIYYWFVVPLVVLLMVQFWQYRSERV